VGEYQQFTRCPTKGRSPHSALRWSGHIRVYRQLHSDGMIVQMLQGAAPPLNTKFTSTMMCEEVVVLLTFTFPGRAAGRPGCRVHVATIVTRVAGHRSLGPRVSVCVDTPRPPGDDTMDWNDETPSPEG